MGGFPRHPSHGMGGLRPRGEKSARALAAIRAAWQFPRMAETAKPKKKSRKIFKKKSRQPSRNVPVGDERYALREGEVAVELPAQFDAALYYIGRIRTPWQRRGECPKNARESDAVCTVELDPRWAAGLSGLETVSHVVLLYWMDQARRDLVLQKPRHYKERRGTFALRSPARPNPVALSVARLIGIDGNTLSVVGLDCLDNTPLLDIKPYFASTDSVPDARVGWHAGRKS
jgi:tRNA-Thr(GGU) m(6)t(6)A37 methyltransferase TsaA